MQAQLYSGDVVGILGRAVRVEVAFTGGKPGATIVGLPGKSVRESYERVRVALASSGFPPPEGHVVVNLAPASEKKDGSAFDLAIALGILVAAGRLSHAPP